MKTVDEDTITFKSGGLKLTFTVEHQSYSHYFKANVWVNVFFRERQIVNNVALSIDEFLVHARASGFGPEAETVAKGQGWPVGKGEAG